MTPLPLPGGAHVFTSILSSSTITVACKLDARQNLAGKQWFISDHQRVDQSADSPVSSRALTAPRLSLASTETFVSFAKHLDPF